MSAGKVLLVEDESALRSLITVVLNSAGYEVASATSGEEAVEVIRQHQFEPDLLLSDVELPEMKGTELARILLENRPEIKVLLMSGYGDEASNSTEHPLLPKPFMPNDLLEAVGRFFD